MSDALTKLRAADVLSALDAQTARMLGRLADERSPIVLTALALVSRQAQHGHVCLELSRMEEQGVLGPVRIALGQEPWESLEALRAALAGSPLVGGVGKSTHERPLCFDGSDRLYLRRLYDQERAVASSILALAASPARRVDEAVLRHGLEQLFGSTPVKAVVAPVARATKRAARDQLDLFGGPEPTEAQPGPKPAPTTADAAQRAAAEHAVRHRFSVVSGGPGTGKTFTVVKMLALLVEQARAFGEPPPKLLLLAPTGKAAARLSESVGKAKANLKVDSNVLAAITDQASTLHRALGIRRQLSMQRASEPLAADVIVVDEASMVDLGMMERLLAAVPEHARLILLGDKDQLASVEAGAVLGDICGEGANAESGSPLARSITTLTRSHRFADDSAIKLLAAATERFAPLFEGAAAERLSALERFRVLCAHRQGPFGVVELNRAVETALRRAGVLRDKGLSYAGRPILITENSYEAKLWNGDVAVLAHDPVLGLRACFAHENSPDGVRRLPLARLPAHESVYAMSVHKSQGSEVDEVAVVLPNEDSPLLSRELLYTAVTRARQRVVIYAKAATLKLCIERRVARASGLRDALWGPQRLV